MTSSATSPYPPVLIRAEEAEHLDSIGHVLLADSSWPSRPASRTLSVRTAIRAPQP